MSGEPSKFPGNKILTRYLSNIGSLKTLTQSQARKSLFKVFLHQQRTRLSLIFEQLEEEWMRANRRQSLAELCNPKLVGLAQVPHRTADREDRRKWQPPHNMGEPQTENTLDNTFKHRNWTNGQILR